MELNWTSSLHFPRKRQLDSAHSWMGSQVFCSLNIQVYNCLYFWESDRIILLIEPMCRTCVTLTLLRFHLSKAKWSICHWCERMQISMAILNILCFWRATKSARSAPDVSPYNQLVWSMIILHFLPLLGENSTTFNPFGYLFDLPQNQRWEYPM